MEHTGEDGEANVSKIAHTGRKSASSGTLFHASGQGLVADHNFIYVNEKLALGSPSVAPQFLGGVASGAGSVGGSWLMSKLVELFRKL